MNQITAAVGTLNDSVSSKLALAKLAGDPETNRLTVDLPKQVIRAGNTDVAFDIEPLRKDAIIRGLDAVMMTLDDAEAIRAFEKRHFRDNPWFA